MQNTDCDVYQTDRAMKILITGSAGFIGGHLTDTLLRRGHTVVGLDKRKTGTVTADFNALTGNILDETIVREAMAGCEVVCHLAAEHQDWGISRDQYFEVNQTGTKVLLDCADQLGVKRFVFFSSVAVYGTQAEPTTEETIPRPDNDYGASKLAAEREIETWCRAKDGAQAVIVRPTVVYGERMNDYSNIYRLVNQIARRRFLFIGPMTNTKSLAYVENLVQATLFLIQRQDSGVSVYNYAESDHLTAREIATSIAAELGVALPPFSLPLRPSLLLAGILDIAAQKTGINLPITSARIRKVNTPTYHRAEKIIKKGFHPEFTNHEGLRKTCRWFLQNRA